jgi:acyl-CoA thioester hydrolase
MMGRGSFSKTVTIAPNDCEALSGVTPSAALRFMQDVATAGIEATGFTHSVLLETYHLVFVTAAHAVRFVRPVHAGETLTVRTDPVTFRGAHFLRQTLFTDESGALVIEGQTDWTLIDAASGRPQRSSAYPGILDPLEGEWTPFADPSRLRIAEADTPAGEHRVVFADTDQNRHMNNTVYARLMTDCFAGEDVPAIGSFFLKYHRQAREGEIIALSRGRGADGQFLASGTIDGQLCFSASFCP